MNCIECGSLNLVKNGTYNTSSGKKYRYKCSDCGKAFATFTIAETEEKIELNETVIKKNKRIVITSANNGSDIHVEFFETLKNYCLINKCQLMVIPTRHKNIGEPFNNSFPEEIENYLMRENLHFMDHKLKILGAVTINSSSDNPLSGLDSISRGDSVIVGHPQIQLKTLPRSREPYPAIISSTGTISLRDYLPNKSGSKADYNHVNSAMVIEFDDGFVHLRHLNYSDKFSGFHDLETFYTIDSKRTESAQAMITGDEHVIFADKSVVEATYADKNSICNVLKPKLIVRHDVFDAYSISHHHAKNFLIRYKKFGDGLCRVEEELERTIDFINETTPSDSTSVIVQSNHNEHLTRWLNECDPKTEPWNAKVYHKLMYEMLDNIDNGKTVDAFELYSRDKLSSNIMFIDRNEGLEISGIMLEAHGDVGTNGSRGSRKQFSMLPTKSVIGHSHSPGIEKGCYQVGTTSIMRLEYNVGASSWHHAHCIIHKDGNRQLIFITNGKYRC